MAVRSPLINHHHSILPKGRSFTAISGAKAAVLPEGRSSTKKLRDPGCSFTRNGQLRYLTNWLLRNSDVHYRLFVSQPLVPVFSKSYPIPIPRMTTHLPQGAVASLKFSVFLTSTFLQKTSKVKVSLFYRKMYDEFIYVPVEYRNTRIRWQSDELREANSSCLIRNLHSSFAQRRSVYMSGHAHNLCKQLKVTCNTLRHSNTTCYKTSEKLSD